MKAQRWVPLVGRAYYLQKLTDALRRLDRADEPYLRRVNEERYWAFVEQAVQAHHEGVLNEAREAFAASNRKGGSHGHNL